MPNSAVNGKSVIKEFIESQSDIKTIVDVGCGQGTYAKLLGKEYEYIGIEIFPAYIEKFNLLPLYKEILIGDVYEFTVGIIHGGMPDGDCIIFGDVLEHLEDEEATFVLLQALQKYNHVILSIPVDGREGKVHYGNEHEKHLSSWTFEELEEITNWKRTAESKGIGVFCK